MDSPPWMHRPEQGFPRGETVNDVPARRPGLHALEGDGAVVAWAQRKDGRGAGKSARGEAGQSRTEPRTVGKGSTGCDDPEPTDPLNRTALVCRTTAGKR